MVSTYQICTTSETKSAYLAMLDLDGGKDVGAMKNSELSDYLAKYLEYLLTIEFNKSSGKQDLNTSLKYFVDLNNNSIIKISNKYFAH